MAPRRTSKPEPELRTLWKAKLRMGANAKDEFVFRAGEDASEAAIVAQRLVESSPACEVAGAVIVAIERLARLWN